MYEPLPSLPEKFKRIIARLKRRKIHPKLLFFTLGILSTLWFLFRVIPKPSRASYPCMQATAPFMSSFVLFLLSLGGSALSFKYFRRFLYKAKYHIAIFFIAISAVLFMFSQLQFPSLSLASVTGGGPDEFLANVPIGEAKGIFPGRVVWMWDADATNENCSNTSNSNGIIDAADDAWFMAVNNDEEVIDSMISKALLAVTGAEDNASSWKAIFEYYKKNKGISNEAYESGEKILFKINATTAYGGLTTARYNTDLSRNDDKSLNDFAAETNPYVVLAMLRQLVYFASIPEEMIYLGDPARNIYKEHFDLWSAEFPNVNYLGNDLLHPELEIVNLGRLPVKVSSEDKVFFSDKGELMPDAISDKLFSIFEEIDYLINIPTMKAHSTAGITLAAKNHFGSFTRDWALHLHAGLMDSYDDPQRLGYGLYRVQTDIMMHNLLSGKNLLMIVDALYPGEDALGVPEKWTSPPFENDWCSSIFMSLDPVAIEAVCHDFLRTEYNGPTVEESRPNWFGVDDYLQQAADSSYWPDDIIYDPDNDGVLIKSLGVHEHWDDFMTKNYSRNLGIGLGIELYRAHEQEADIEEGLTTELSVYPNPIKNHIYLSNPGYKKLNYVLTDINAKVILTGSNDGLSLKKIDLNQLNNGLYFLLVEDENEKVNFKVLKQ